MKLGVLIVLGIAVAFVLRLWSRLGDTGLLQGNVGPGSSQAVEDDLHNETED